MRLKDLIRVAPRYSRSVSLDRDSESAEALDGYILTTTANNTLGRILDALVDPAGQRAWTLTGPYGSGKSAFALYLAHLLGESCPEAHHVARQILKEQRHELYREFFDGRSRHHFRNSGYVVVHLGGTQEPLLPRLLDAFCRASAAVVRGTSAKVPLRNLQQLRDASIRGEQVSTAHAVELMTSISRRLHADHKARGVLVIIDELGKFLEFAASSPDAGDIFVLQLLAEATAPSAGNHLALVTVLHQALERYSAGVPAAVREEWVKIQGRFEDIAFQESADGLLELIGAAIRQSSHPSVKKMRAAARERADRLCTLGLKPRSVSKQDFIRTLEDCAPLHPLTVLVLTRLCRKFGQNQRSLFSFLVSREPHGFADFLETELSENSLVAYGLTDLFDYVNEALGETISLGEAGSRWAAAQNALDRVVDCTADEARLLKTVGLLTAVGPYGELRPSVQILKASLDVKPTATFLPLQSLVKRSILIDRKYNNTIGLWEGSDIDLDERLKEAAQQLPDAAAFAVKVNSAWTSQPIIAKRHSHLTGTLRYFAVAFADVSNFSKSLSAPPDADGLLVYCLPTNSEDFGTLAKLATSYSADHPEVVIALPREIETLRSAVRQLELLRWVESNTPELQSDPVARKELRSRVTWNESLLALEMRKLFSPGESVAKNTLWFTNGHSRPISTARSFSNLLSSVCDNVYYKTPILQNELINRRNLSSAAAAARKVLLTAMVQSGARQNLGFEGHPPELSMYRSVLQDSGIHRDLGDSFGFMPPRESHSLFPVWRAIVQFFDECELQRKPISELFERLQGPPFGLKMGAIPVLFVAAVLAHDAEVALYEDGIFTPELTVESVERLLRVPQKFELRRYRIEGVRREVFSQMSTILGSPIDLDKSNLIDLMRPLYRFFHRLPPYTRQTKRLSPVALAVRQALADAREPDVLLFTELPRACGVAPFSADGDHRNALPTFFKQCRGAVLELQKTYEDLIAELREMLFKAAGVSGPQARETLRGRAQDVSGHVVEARLRAFANNLSDELLDDFQWIEAVATMIVGKVPKAWNDGDCAKYEVTLSDLSRGFRHIWYVVRERTNQKLASGVAAEVMRLGVSDLHSGNAEQLITVLPVEGPLVAAKAEAIELALQGSGDADDRRLAAAALGIVLRKYLRDSQTEASSEPTTVAAKKGMKK